MVNRILSFIQKHNLLPESSTVIVGLSGGPDSIFLLHLLAALRQEKQLTLIAAHLDHEWRPDSANDVAFCQQAATALSIPFVHAQASEVLPHRKRQGSQEAIGRTMRRIFLENVALDHQADTIALGHHLQDQEETFFIRLIRGTTLTGLIGMRPKHGLYIRPLLETNKEDIVTYLHEHTIPYLIDPTNVLESYLRNRIRKHVLPALQHSDVRFDHNFLRTLHNLQSAEQALEHQTHSLFQTIAVPLNGSHALDIKKLLAVSTYLQKRLLVHWLILEKTHYVLTDKFLEEILRFLGSNESKQHTIHHEWALVKEKNLVYVKKLS